MPVESPVIKHNVDLAAFNTLNIHATARYFSCIQTVEALGSLVTSLRWQNEPKYILGGGSNILFVDDFDGLVIKVAISGREVIKKNSDFIWLKVGAGENWHKTVRYCVKQGWGGVENLSLIPGKTGAAPIQNIGAYGVELQDVFESLTALEIATGKQRIFTKEACQFGYRDSIFKHALKNTFIITDVTLKLPLHPRVNTSYGAIKEKLREKGITEPTIRDISDIVIEIRNSKLPDPAKLANAGSFFKNPVISNTVFEELKEIHPAIPGYPTDGQHTKVPAGWLIEQTGWKGKKMGQVGTYRQQALVIVNYGGTTGEEILQLAREIQQSVKKEFDIKLTPEVNIVE